MKYELETIPVWDALRADTECPLCLLQSKAEEGYVQFFLGNSVMVPEMRVQVNEVGFCPRHYVALLGGGNRLGLALITHTHIQELRRRLTREGLGTKGGSPASLRRKIRELGGFLREHVGRCMICDRLAERFRRYAFTIVYLWEHDGEFRAALKGSRGFCLPHVSGLMDMAADILSGRRLPEFLAELMPLQERAWDRLERELLAFTGKFDYQSTGGVGTSTREAVADAITKLTGATPISPSG